MSEPKKNNSGTINHQQIAMVFAVEPRTITKWCNDLGMPKSGRGQYNLVECVQWRCGYLEKKIKTLTEGGTEGMNQGTRLKKVNSEIKEYHLAKLRGELVGLYEIMPVITEGLNRIRQRSQSFGQRTAPQLQGMEVTEMAETLQEHINELFTDLASIPNALRRMEKFARYRTPEGVRDPEASAKNDGERVVRSKKNAVTRDKPRARKVSSK